MGLKRKPLNVVAYELDDIVGLTTIECDPLINSTRSRGQGREMEMDLGLTIGKI